MKKVHQEHFNLSVTNEPSFVGRTERTSPSSETCHCPRLMKPGPAGAAYEYVDSSVYLAAFIAGNGAVGPHL
jgi:hypothetical protein